MKINYAYNYVFKTSFNKQLYNPQVGQKSNVYDAAFFPE